MTKIRLAALASLGLLGLLAGPTFAGPVSWSVGVRLGAPVYPRPWYGCCPGPYYYYRPYPVVVESLPIFVQPAPVLQPVPAVAPIYAPPPPSPVVPVVAQAPPSEQPGDLDGYLRRLADPDEQVRAGAVAQLGRARSARAVDPLAATLAGDRSPAVREAAARALALIGSPRALPALQRAAFADADRDVRHSAQFAIDVIQAK